MIRIRRFGIGRRYSKQMIAALRKTLQSYEAAIASPQRSLPRWDDYGRYAACNLCRAAGYARASFFPECRKCVLGPSDEGCCDDTMHKLGKAICLGRGFKKALIARRDWIIARCRENGVHVTITEDAKP